MRHFYASVALASGVSVKEPAEYLGHHDPGYMLRIYTHLIPSAADGTFKPRHAGAARLEDPETALRDRPYLCQNLTPLHVTVIGPAPLEVR